MRLKYTAKMQSVPTISVHYNVVSAFQRLESFVVPSMVITIVCNVFMFQAHNQILLHQLIFVDK